MEEIKKQIRESINVKKALIENHIPTIKKMADIIASSLRKGGCIYVFGNGGSAADAQHFACELVEKFQMERLALPVIALTTNTSILTATSNDRGYDYVFSRQIEAFAKEGDVVIGISTSGVSANVIEAIGVASQKKAKTLVLTGKGGGKLKSLAEVSLVVDSDNTPRIQEAHITILHILCDIIEKEMFEKK